VKWTPGTKNDDVVDVRGKRTSGGLGGRGVKLGAGSIVTVLVVLAVARFTGVDISSVLGGSSSNTTPSASPAEPAPPAGTDPDAPVVDYIRFVMKDIQDTFELKFEQKGKTYQRAKLYVFSNEIDTACGRSSAAIGPFYCPGDSQAYIDLGFFKLLESRFGAPGKFAQAYVLAHEIGHHVQNLIGTPPGRSNEHSVRVELQADCYAGVWGHDAKTSRDLLDSGDLDDAITAAQAIGDDRLQKQAGGKVNPESFTHGTSAQRVKWFKIGFASGDISSCDTFSEAKP